MPTTYANGIDIYYEVYGPKSAPPLLLINGFTSQMARWSQTMVDLFVTAGFRLICFDNRDVGLTSKTEGPLPEFRLNERGVTELVAPPPYTISDMAADGVALLDALEIARAHVVGTSMGGMIAQRMAIEHPERLLTLTSIMSTTGDPKVGRPTSDAMKALVDRAPPEREAYIDHSARTDRVISGPLFDEVEARERAARVYDRCYHPIGAVFQMAAIRAETDRTALLAGVRVPTLVIHGGADPLISVSGGEATAAAIPGAELVVLDEMGHDLPESLLPDIIGAIVRVAARA